MRLKNETRKEKVIQKSRFIACGAPVRTEAEAKEYIAYIREEFRDATHVCTAYIIGANDEFQKSNDNHEPAGTAGIPILEAIRNAKLSDTAVCVVRYFGGIKLGTGGLIRAYGGVTAALLQEADKTKDIHIDTWQLDYPYEYIGHVENWIRNNAYEYSFYYDELAHAAIAANHDDLHTVLLDLTKGNIQIKKTGTVTKEVPVQP